MEKSIATRAADNIRLLSVAMVEKAASGHPGGPMGGADYIQILFSEFLRYDPDNGAWPFRDRFFLDAGHMSPMLYSQLVLNRTLSLEDVENFRQWHSPTPGHPELDVNRGIENTSGPLGLGHAFGAGAAIAERFLVERFGEWMGHYSYLYVSDGGIQEEISQGIGRIAGFLGLGKIIMFYDANDIQLSTKVGEVSQEDTAKKYESWNWHVLTIDGNNEDEIRAAIKQGQNELSRPTLIIGQTIMGKGAVKADGSSHEGEVETHGKPIGKSNASYEETIKNIGGNPDNAFVVFPEVQNYYDKVIEEKRRQSKAHHKVYADWQASNPEMAKTLDFFLSGKLPEIDWTNIPVGENTATRNASSAVLSYLAGKVENMIVASADLSNSDKTDGFLKKTTAFKNGDFSGAFLQAGVSELSMAALATGMALHGGVIPVCGTFFAFSDYMKPVLRVAALMETPVKFIWTHDAFRVGEDGPTHQPVEQEAQLRLLEKLHNHSGNSSFLALRPADGPETVATWKMMLECNDRPSGLILSRQNIEDVPAIEFSRLEEAMAAESGAYLVLDCEGEPDVVLIGNGSEVSTLYAGAQRLIENHKLNIRIVSVPSEGLFRSQSKDYQSAIIPPNVPTFGMTAGLPVTLQGLMNTTNRIHGMTHFGYSAPYKVLDVKFGYTGENVEKQVLALLGQ